MRDTARIVAKSADYEKLYHQLFNELTDGIEWLQKIQQRVEDLYCSQTESIEVPEYIQLVK